MNQRQQEKLWDIVYEWVGTLNDDAVAAKMAEVKTNLKETYFAWSGPTTQSSAAYYRIQGPTLLIEFSPQAGRADWIRNTSTPFTVIPQTITARA